MRDLLIASIVLVGVVMALRRPWIGALLWAWLSLMNPHRFAFGFAYDAPLAAAAAGATMLGLLITRDRRSPFASGTGTVLAIFMVWMTLSWLLGLDREGDYEQWKKVMKIDVMTLVVMAVIISRTQIVTFAWVVAGSLAVLGLKGGIFTILNGGNYRVWGPPGTFIEDNNEFALALVMTIPLLRFLQQQVQTSLGRHLLTVVMLLCAAAALGSHSRGGLLAIAAMAVVLWWRGSSRMMMGAVMAVAAVTLLAFMPESWTLRMSTIDNYEEDLSALGRISAWWTAFGIAKHYPTGIGFDLARPELFALYSPYPTLVHAAHSIYFLVLGNHGFVGLALFLLLFTLTWRQATSIRKQARQRPDEWRWCAQLANMCQVSLAGYAVGGAFLSLAYFDLPYYLMVMTSATLLWMRQERPLETVKVPGGLLGRLAGLAGLSSPPPAKPEPLPPATGTAERPGKRLVS